MNNEVIDPSRIVTRLPYGDQDAMQKMLHSAPPEIRNAADIRALHGMIYNLATIILQYERRIEALEDAKEGENGV